MVWILVTKGFGREPSLILLKKETLRPLLSPIRVNIDWRFSTEAIVAYQIQKTLGLFELLPLHSHPTLLLRCAELLIAYPSVVLRF